MRRPQPTAILAVRRRRLGVDGNDDGQSDHEEEAERTRAPAHARAQDGPRMHGIVLATTDGKSATSEEGRDSSSLRGMSERAHHAPRLPTRAHAPAQRRVQDATSAAHARRGTEGVSHELWALRQLVKQLCGCLRAELVGLRCMGQALSWPVVVTSRCVALRRSTVPAGSLLGPAGRHLTRARGDCASSRWHGIGVTARHDSRRSQGSHPVAALWTCSRFLGELHVAAAAIDRRGISHTRRDRPCWARWAEGSHRRDRHV